MQRSPNNGDRNEDGNMEEPPFTLTFSLYESRSESTTDDDEQYREEVQRYKNKCRVLEDEKNSLIKTIPLLRDAQGKDVTREFKSLIEKERKAREECEFFQAGYNQVMGSFADYKHNSDKQRRSSNEMKQRAEREERENKELRKIIDQAGIHLEVSPNGTFRQALSQQHQYMNTLPGSSKQAPRHSVSNFLDQRYSNGFTKNSQSCHTAIPMLGQSLYNNKTSDCNGTPSSTRDRYSLLNATLVLAIITLVIVLFVHIFKFFQQS